MINHIAIITDTPPNTILADALQAEGISVVIRPIEKIHKAWHTVPGAFIVDAGQHIDHTSELIRIIRTNPVLQPVPLLALTANNAAARLAALQAGADDCLTAPLDWVEIVLRLRQYLQRPENTTLGNPDWLGVSNVLSHDLKNPLGTIVSSLELLREMVKDETASIILHSCVLAANRQSHLLDDLIDFTRLENRVLNIKLEPIDLQSVIDDIRPMADPVAESKGLHPEWRIPFELPPVQANAALLGRALLALIDNAIRYCTRDNQLIIDAAETEVGMVIRVMDNGRELYREFDDVIFKLWPQWEARSAGSRSTIAMNLPFAAAAVEAMGGDAAAYTGEDYTCFTIRLNLATNVPK